MAHKKGEGSTANGRDSRSKRLGVKLFGGQMALAGNIIVRQRGNRFHPGENVYQGKDYTLHAAVDGTVFFRRGQRDRTFVGIHPFEEFAEETILEQTAEVADVKAAKPERAAKPQKQVEVAPAEPAQEPVLADSRSVAAPAEEATSPEVVEDEVVAPAEETAPEVVAAATTAADEAVVTSASNKDDLKIVEGIGPKIESLLNEDGIFTFAELAQTTPERIREILDAAGPRYKMFDPTTWPRQSQLAAEGKMDELKELQDSLKGGKE